MNQVGDTKILSFSVIPPATSGIYAYVWEFWDGTVAVTTEPRVEKRLNIGGNPLDSRKLYFTCTPTTEDGQSTVIHGSVQVNNPPYIIPSPLISNNDDFFPYPTQISLTAYDVENEGMSFLYYDSGGNPLGGGITTSVGAVNGTWNGTGGSYNGYSNVFSGTIASQSTITLKIVDVANGTRTVDFKFYGDVPPPPTIGVTAKSSTLTVDASSIPDQRIGPGQMLDFTCYAADAVSSNFVFVWSFYGSLGWNGNTFASGTSVPTPDGSVRNAYSKDISGETGGNKTALVKVTNTDSLKSVELPLYLSLIANTVASTCTFNVVDESSLAYAAGATVNAGRKLFYTATAIDPQNDVLQYKWTFAQPPGINPATLRVWGRTVMIDTTGFPPGASITGSFLVIDRMSGQATFAVPALVIA